MTSNYTNYYRTAIRNAILNNAFTRVTSNLYYKSFILNNYDSIFTLAFVIKVSPVSHPYQFNIKKLITKLIQWTSTAET